MSIECKVINIVEIGLHTQFIGEVLDIKIDGAMEEKDLIDQIKPLIFAPGNGSYYGIGSEISKAFSAGRSLAAE